MLTVLAALVLAELADVDAEIVQLRACCNNRRAILDVLREVTPEDALAAHEHSCQRAQLLHVVLTTAQQQ